MKWGISYILFEQSILVFNVFSMTLKIQEVIFQI